MSVVETKDVAEEQKVAPTVDENKRLRFTIGHKALFDKALDETIMPGIEKMLDAKVVEVEKKSRYTPDEGD
jgi:hypothetical protein